MLDLPSPIINYLHSLTFENRSPAYLLVDKNGCLSEWGGKLAAYGITNLQKGQYVTEQLFFLEGLLPGDDFPIFLPCIKTEYGRCADLHILPADEGDWVLLLDATLEEIQHSLIQQQGNDLSLLRQEQARILNQDLGRDIPEDLAPDLFKLHERGERKDVTILFAHIWGLSAYSEEHPPEVVFRMLNLCFTNTLQQILDEAGLVDKIVGDLVTAFFGVVPASGSSRDRAVKAALRMIEAVRDIGKISGVNHGSKLDISIGIASGPVALGILGGRLHRTFNAIGYHVNLAARLESQARPSEILIDENTFNQTGNILQQNFAPASLLLQGIADPIRIYSWLVT